MIRITLAAAAGLLIAAPANAQSISQSDLQDRYDRALAAGYKAMFLCSAIANAERNGATRTPESVMEWELTGIQAPLDDIVRRLPHRITYRIDPERPQMAPEVDMVAVEWAEGAEPRVARHLSGRGCAIYPIGTEDIETPEGERARSLAPRMFVHTMPSPTQPVADLALTDQYGVDARTTQILIRHNTRLAAYATADGWEPGPQRTWSVAKSIAATLVGAAVQRGEVNVMDSAGLGESDEDPRRAITIDQLLRMASGRYSDTPGNRTDPLYFGGATVDEVALDWPLIHEPGSVYRYANNDTLAAIAAIEHTFQEHSPAELFDRLDMTGAVAETDWQGNYVLSSQVWATANDLLNLGELHLRDGVWGGERILPEGWVEYISSPAGPQPGGSRGWGYGAGWWLLNNSEGIPPDTFMAAGNRGQYIVVVPSRDVVIVRRGEDPAGGSGFDIVAFTRDVLAALDE
ncbi:serine hydrolase domain-containing protein [Aurantiacibacter sp. D1-12]|uniref:serine hydrolase domain-containing protein n=1 Tax=Aurantiacibacter sp. D1-12 TaxID=2993658 RepID=UPI00237C5651|nr:serine hydrolase [Aurantiacibacter sp. D1-12]MDE1468006.1 serine hydrolase [Aurantiacibacter sp. D1-12]